MVGFDVNTQAILLVSLVALLGMAMIGYDFGLTGAEGPEPDLRLGAAPGGT